LEARVESSVEDLKVIKGVLRLFKEALRLSGKDLKFIKEDLKSIKEVLRLFKVVLRLFGKVPKLCREPLKEDKDDTDLHTDELKSHTSDNLKFAAMLTMLQSMNLEEDNTTTTHHSNSTEDHPTIDQVLSQVLTDQQHQDTRSLLHSAKGASFSFAVE